MDALRGDKKNVGRGLWTPRLLGTHDGVEPVEHADCLQGSLGGSPRAACGDRHGKDSAKAASDFHHDCDWLKEIERLTVEAGIPLFGYGGDIDKQALFLRKTLDYLVDRETGPAVKALFRQVEIVAKKYRFPNLVMKGHGVNESSVTVEDQALDARWQSPIQTVQIESLSMSPLLLT